MMKSFFKTSWLWAAVLLTALECVMPQELRADDGDFDNPQTAFTWYAKGQGCLHLKLMTTNASPLRTLHDATYSLRDAEGNSHPIIYVGEKSSDNSGYVRSVFKNLMSSQSLLYLTNDTYWKPLCLISGNDGDQHDATRNGKNNGYAEFDWYYPTDFAGKTYTLHVEATMWHDKGSDTEYKKDIGTIAFDAISFQTYDIIPGAESGDEGTVKIPFSCDRPVCSVEASYTDEDGRRKTTKTIRLPDNTYAGFIKLPATEAHKDLIIRADVLSGKPSDADVPRTEWRQACTGIITTNIDSKNDAVIHNPRVLQAHILNDTLEVLTDYGAILLQWKVRDAQYPDLLEGDEFLVQRSLTGKEEDFETVGSVTFSSTETEYQYKDSRLVSDLTPELVDQNLGIPLVRYRVARASALRLWGAEKNPAVAYVQPQLPTFALLTPIDGSAEWSNQTERRVLVRWNYAADTEQNAYVWDSRAQMTLHTYVYNRQNQLIDSTSVVLTEAEIQAQAKEITLSRSCVHYSMRIDVDSKDSPIGQGTGRIFALIKSREDFENYALGIFKRPTTSPNNAIFAADITISSQYAEHWLGYMEDKPFTGNLNGNGYTLTVDWPVNAQANVEYLAPIRFAGSGAVICNLTTAGNNKPQKKFAGGIIGTISTGSLFIENCTSNIYFNIDNTYNDASSGGLIGIIDLNSGKDNSKSLRISNCLYNASYKAQMSWYCGGFVGWRRKGTFGMITSSFFNPTATYLYRKDGSATFMRSEAEDIQNEVIQDCTFSLDFGKEQGVKSTTPPTYGLWTTNGRIPIQKVRFTKPISHSQWEVKLPDDKFYFENIGQIDTASVRGQVLQSSFVLTWENVDDNPVDYYEVWRRDVKEKEFRPIVTQLDQMMYEDGTTSPVHNYEYFVRGVNNCEGTKYLDSKVISGHCVQTGTVEGYLRFADGTGIPGDTIYITSPDGSISEIAVTDESGYYRKEGLPYFDETETTYTAAPNINGFSGVRNVTFGTRPGENEVKDIVFVMEKSVKFSGYVQYNGTSIPVQGVSFYLDGREVHTASGKVVSDHEGKFSFRMLEGAHTIQAKKDGHVFFQKGYYHENEDTTQLRYHFSVDKSGVLFYDDTRVKLIGRIAGGRDQEALPLDNSLSRNNLGDDLQMVLTLEGDNKSRLVWDNQNTQLKERDEVFRHTAHDKMFEYQTNVHTTLNRKVVRPDIHTGEYVVWLPPVKWKIQQITAKGYATLFQDGKTGDVIDLTDSVVLHTQHYTGDWKAADKKTIPSVEVKYHAIYNRIYHSPVLIEYKQLGIGGNSGFDFLGERYYQAKNLLGESVQVPLAYPVRKEGWPVGRKDSLEAVYTFGHPVFRTNLRYPIRLSAIERYYYNNNTKSDTIDIVRLSGGNVTVQNGLVSSTHRQEVPLDSVGEGMFYLEAAQLPYLLTGEDALRTVTMTLLMDGTRYEAKPLRAYIFNTAKKTGARDLLSINKPELMDILRDPPGGGSSAKLSRGSTLKYGYTFDWAASGGIKLTFGFGTKVSQYVGVVAVAAESGLINNGSSKFAFDIDLMFSGSGKQAYSYTLTANSDISTSSEKTMVGANADVYIGTETSYVVTPAISIRAINETMWRQLQGAREAGTMKEIARGYSATGDTLHLVRDEVLSIGPKINSTFIHTQSYILKQLIPRLEKECKSLLFVGSKSEAQAVADSTGAVVYWSLREPNDDNFGVVNTEKAVSKGDNAWTYFYNTTIDKARDGINYMIVRPSYDKSDKREDRIGELCQSALWWAEMIARNEKEKLEATTLVKNFDIDGGAPMSYSEDFAADIAYTSQVHYFWQSPPSNIVVQGLKWLKSLLAKRDKVGPAENSSDNIKEGEINWAGYDFTFDIIPAATYNYNTPYSTEKKFNRKESFTISMDKKSHLDVDVYAVKNTFANGSNGTFEVFSNKNFSDAYNKVSSQVTHSTALVDVGKVKQEDIIYPRGFVYRTRGGATCRPWEPERTTTFYQSGTVLDQRTKKIENPVITMDRQSLSGVPFGEPARFKVYMTNESEAPEAVYNFFGIYLVERSNPKGAKVMMDGVPLTGDTRTLDVRPGIVTEKTIEVWAAEDFDYENLQIGLVSLGDLDVNQQVQFSVHFLRTAGNVEIATPGDKWIMNTDAPYDADRGWYMPVVISGFNKNQPNFDHIEFQYKESTRGDDFWTNLCGFYADSTLYRAASGTAAMIPENGNIITHFFGEGLVMEKAYDLRAVLFCRNGNGFLTSSSKVLGGVKDTRRPQLFGTPEPKDGVLGAGDNIVFNFSEDIEYNYLQATTNFTVKGETNETTIQEEPSLMFDGKGYAQSEATRNFSNRSVTVEVMIRPDATGTPMPIFSHGRDGKQLQLWLTEDRRLRAIVDDKVLETKTPMEFLAFKRVALSLDNDLKRLSIFGAGLDATMDSVTYSGYGPLIFGSTNQTDAAKRSFYKGRMLQARVWNRAMNIDQLNAYGNQLLTGYEMGLTDYYPMNEGRGAYATDEALGAHLALHNVSWAQPRGMSLHLDRNEQREVKGLKLKPDFIHRTSEQDYTLLFWFKTDGSGTLLANGAGRANDVDAKNKFFIGFEGQTLKYRTGGHEFPLGNTFCDGTWHHYAMTVNRAHQVVSIYVDNDLKAQFTADSLGGITGDCYVGNMVWKEQGLHNDVLHQQNALTGHIDGLALFGQALPPTLIKRYTSKSIGGEEQGLVTFMGFERQQRQKNGELTLQPFALNQKVKRDMDGQPTEEFDSVFAEPIDDILKHIDRNTGAPMQAYEELRNLNFSFVGRNNQLLVNIDELDSRVNKRRVYVTVSDIPDRNGNFMASPKTVAVFVNRNPLRWSQKTFKATMAYGYGVDYQFDMGINNDSGASHTYKVEHLPKWLSVNTPSDIIDAQAAQTLTFTIHKDINVGTYDDVIYLTDENGLSEPLLLNITIEGKVPDWWVFGDMKQFSMGIVGQVMIGDDIVTDSRDMVSVFDITGRCMGLGNVNYDPVSAESLVYLTIYDSLTVAKPIFFQLWHYETGKTMVLTPSNDVTFKPETFVGTTNKPLVLRAGNQFVQTIDLKPGWNWVSLNVMNNAYREVENLLSWFDWQDGDMLTHEAKNLSLLYRNGQWLSNKGSAKLSEMTFDVASSYRIKVGKSMRIELTGDAIKAEGDRTIPVKTGWNSIGYTPMVNLPVATALADYLDDALDGDVVKSQTEFAMFTIGANGSREWKGNLKYMKPDEGYMLYRQKEGDTKFVYPFFEPNAAFFDGGERQRAPQAYAYNMTMVAETEGCELQKGDRLVAFVGAERVGTATYNPPAGDEENGDREQAVFYLTISSGTSTTRGAQEALSFAIEREGDIIATTGHVMDYQPNAISGSPKKPTKISFVNAGTEATSDDCYDLSGRKMPKGRWLKGNLQRGVYIFNGRKHIIK